MTYENLADFIAELEDDGELIRVTAEVDPHLEAAEIIDRVCKMPGGGPALLFDNLKGSSLPVVANLLGSQYRLCKALRTDAFESIAQRVSSLIKPDVPENWLETLRLVPQFTQLTKLPPKIVKTGVCQQVVKMGRDVDLRELPILQSWPNDAGPTITMGQIYSRHPETGYRSLEMLPLIVRNRDSLFVQWDIHCDGWRNFMAYRARRQQMPIAIALGGDPVLPFVAGLPLPAHTDACLFAGFLRNQNLEMVQCRNHDLEVPAHAELVIEGYLDTESDFEQAGTIGLGTGFYGADEELPVLQVTAITHRSNPVYPTILHGAPPTEDYWIGRATERIYLPLVKLFIPELVDYHMPRAGNFRHLLFVSIRKEYPQQARKVMYGLWSLQRLMATKLIVVVDADVDVRDEEHVWFLVGANVHPGRDVVFCEGPADMQDHAAPQRGQGHKMGIDATRKLPEEGHPRTWPAAVTMSPEVRQRVVDRWREFGLEQKLGDIRPS